MPMKFYTTINSNTPLIKVNNRIINLNTLSDSLESEIVLVKTGKKLKISKHRNDKFIEKAGRFFKVSRIAKFYGNGWYKLESNIILLCLVQGDTIQLVGNYPIHYLKLIYRFINNSL